MAAADDKRLTVDVLCPAEPTLIADVTLNEVSISESLLSPTIHASIKCEQSLETYRNLDNFYAKPILIVIKKPILKQFGIRENLVADLVVYRLSNRKRKGDYTTEVFELSACYPTLIRDAQVWLEDAYIGATASDHAKQIFSQSLLLPDDQINVENSIDPVDVMGERKHPFQVLSALADRAFNESKRPTFLHWASMTDGATGENRVCHYFRSIDSLIARGSINKDAPFVYNFKNVTEDNYENPFDIMSFSFPCDFDLVSDVMNGYTEGGAEFFTTMTFDPYNGKGSVFGETGIALGKNGLAPFASLTNKDTAHTLAQNATGVEDFLVRRRMYMALLEQDKIALKLTIPFNPSLSAGQVITTRFQKNGEDMYGSGDYLIVNLTHALRPKGVSVTILDCVANTIAVGVQ